MKLCRVCGSRLDVRIETRGRHWNCELAGWQIERDTRVVGDRHLVSTGVRWSRCGCGAWTLAALSEGIATAVDPAVVDETTELAALVAGRNSFDLIRAGGRTELMRRDFIRQQTRFYPVCLEHPCNRPVVVDDPLDVIAARIHNNKNNTHNNAEPVGQLRRATPRSETVAAQPPPF